MSDTDVERVAVHQFTVVAEAFASSPVVNDVHALTALVTATRLHGDVRVADIACGPGIVTSALAGDARQVVAVDLTPTMLHLARDRAAAAGHGDTVQFVLGRMDAVPAADASFDRVVSRYALHHAADPAGAVAELARLCAPDGLVVVADFAAPPDPAVAGRYDAAERLRDPSHVANLTRDRQVELLESCGLRLVHEDAYRIEADLDAVLASSRGVDLDAVRRAFEASLDTDGLGVGAHLVDDRVRFAYPIVLLVAQR